MPRCHLDGLMQARCNSIANALELCLSCTNPSIFTSTRNPIVEIRLSYDDHNLHNGISYTGKTSLCLFATLRQKQNGCHLPDIFKWIFLNENIQSLIKFH